MDAHTPQTPKHEKINIRGVHIDNVTLNEAAEQALLLLQADGMHAVYTPNAEIVQLCIEAPDIRALINRADMVIPDGAGVVLAAKILATPLKGKVPGIELGEALVRLSGTNGYGIYLLGGKPGIAEQAQKRLLEKYPDARIVGTHDGYFHKTNEENDRVIEEINASGAAVLFVCLGVPAQEKWIDANRLRLHTHLALGLGGSLDGYAGTVKRAPAFFIRLNLEWFYRLCKEPKRIGRMMKLPKFLFGTLWFKLSGKQKKAINETEPQR